MTFHFRVNFLSGFELPLTWQNEGRMDECVLMVEVILRKFSKMTTIKLRVPNYLLRKYSEPFAPKVLFHIL